jgi:hypothetical protein
MTPRFGLRRCCTAFLHDAYHVASFNWRCALRYCEVWQNLFARQSRFHLIKLLKTIALHAYATIIQN